MSETVQVSETKDKDLCVLIASFFLPHSILFASPPTNQTVEEASSVVGKIKYPMAMY